MSELEAKFRDQMTAYTSVGMTPEKIALTDEIIQTLDAYLQIQQTTMAPSRCRTITQGGWQRTRPRSSP